LLSESEFTELKRKASKIIKELAELGKDEYKKRIKHAEEETITRYCEGGTTEAIPNSRVDE
jgi:F0F1-type ATP synthase membrane subunit b/b'